MNPSDSEAPLLPTLLARLERISADSHFAHLASGVRGALLRLQEGIDASQTIDQQRMKRLVKQGYEILEQAAREKVGI